MRRVLLEHGHMYKRIGISPRIHEANELSLASKLVYIKTKKAERFIVDLDEGFCLDLGLLSKAIH